MTVTNPKFDSGGSQEEIKFWYCMLPCGAEPSVFSSAVEKCKG
jgi:hypothetical protein